MKRGKKSLFYIVSMMFCSLFMFFFGSYTVDAVSFVTECREKDSGDECGVLTDSENAYFIIKEIIVGNESISTLTIPDTYSVTIDTNVVEANVEVLGDGVNELIKVDAANVLNLSEIVLPANLININQYAFYNVNELEEMTLPLTLSSIEANVFENGSKINTIYLNHYEQPNLEKLVISPLAFEGVNLDKIICGSTGVYYYFVDTNPVGGLPFVIEVKYTYYAHENETLTDAVSTVNYFYGDNRVIDGTSIPTPLDLSSEGLVFDKWDLKKGAGTGQESYIEVNDRAQVYYAGDHVVNFKVYPKYKLNSVSFSLNVTKPNGNPLEQDEVIKYVGGSDVLSLNVTNLNILANYQKQYSWYKVVSNPASENKVHEGETLNLKYVNQSGTYKCVINYSYTANDGSEYEGNSFAVIEGVKIEKVKLYVPVEDVIKTYGTYITDQDVLYTVTGLLGTDTIKTVEKSYMGYADGDINVGRYNATVKVLITSIKGEDNLDERIGNYDIAYSFGDYFVNKKEVPLNYDEVSQFTYGDEFDIRTPFSDSNVYGRYSKILVVHLARVSGNDADEYKIMGIKGVYNSEDYSLNNNYNVNLNASSAKVVIQPKPVNVECVVNGSEKCNVSNIVSSVYDGQNKNVEVYYTDINGVKIDLPFRVERNGNETSEIINAGEYAIYVDSLLSKNYTFISNGDKVIYLTVNKAKAIPNYKSPQTFTYTGEKINPYGTIDNDEQEPRFECLHQNHQGNYCINQGEYNVNVTYAETDNYEELIVKGVVVKINYLYINISPKEYSFPYGTVIKATDTITVNGEEVEVVYNVNANNTSLIGSYDITGASIKDTHSSANHPNYVATINYEEGKNKIKITKRPVEIVYYGYENLVYDGKERVIGAYAIDTISREVVNLDIKLSCDEGVIKDAKKYHLRSYFESDFYESINSNLLVFEISKATHDLSHISFNSKEFMLDFKEHAIQIDGKLPEGVSVVYSIDGEVGNSTSKGFSHTVVAKFIVDTNNYLPLDDMSATIKINTTWVFVTLLMIVLLAGMSIALAWVYVLYRRKHPKKIKLKIKNLVDEDLAAKRVATSVKEVLGDDSIEGEIIENEDDIIEKGLEKNFIDRIYAASSELKYYYSEVKNELLSYDGISHSVDRKYEIFYHGTRQVAKLSICNGILRLYVNLDPQKYDKSQYNHRDMSKIEIHARTPLRIDVNTTESLRHAKVFIRILRKKENLKLTSNFVRIDYEKFYTLKENVFPKIFKKMFNINKKGKEKK